MCFLAQNTPRCVCGSIGALPQSQLGELTDPLAAGGEGVHCPSTKPHPRSLLRSVWNACGRYNPRHNIIEWLCDRGQVNCPSNREVHAHPPGNHNGTQCETHRLLPRRNPTATWMASSSNLRPHAQSEERGANHHCGERQLLEIWGVLHCLLSQLRLYLGPAKQSALSQKIAWTEVSRLWLNNRRTTTMSVSRCRRRRTPLKDKEWEPE